MRVVRTVRGTTDSFSDDLSVNLAHGQSQDEETVSIYLGSTERTHYRLNMTLAQAKELSDRLQSAIARRERLKRE